VCSWVDIYFCSISVRITKCEGGSHLLIASRSLWHRNTSSDKSKLTPCVWPILRGHPTKINGQNSVKHTGLVSFDHWMYPFVSLWDKPFDILHDRRTSLNPEHRDKSCWFWAHSRNCFISKPQTPPCWFCEYDCCCWKGCCCWYCWGWSKFCWAGAASELLPLPPDIAPTSMWPCQSQSECCSQ